MPKAVLTIEDVQVEDGDPTAFEANAYVEGATSEDRVSFSTAAVAYLYSLTVNPDFSHRVREFIDHLEAPDAQEQESPQ